MSVEDSESRRFKTTFGWEFFSDRSWPKIWPGIIFFVFFFLFELFFRRLVLIASGTEIFWRVSSKFGPSWQHRVSIVTGLRYAVRTGHERKVQNNKKQRSTFTRDKEHSRSVEYKNEDQQHGFWERKENKLPVQNKAGVCIQNMALRLDTKLRFLSINGGSVRTIILLLIMVVYLVWSMHDSTVLCFVCPWCMCAYRFTTGWFKTNCCTAYPWLGNSSIFLPR